MGLQQHVDKMREAIRAVVPIWQRPTLFDHAEQLEAFEMVIGYGSLMESLAQSPAFQAYTAQLKARLTGICDQMKTCKPVDLLRLQAQNEELEYALNFVPEAINAGKEAQQRRNELRIAIVEQEKRRG